MKRIMAVCLAGLLCPIMAVKAQWVTFDPSNFAQSIVNTPIYQKVLITGVITRKIKSKVSNTTFYNYLFFSDTYDNIYR